MVKHFIHAYLYNWKFVLVTDHNPLTSLKGLKVTVAVLGAGLCTSNNSIWKFSTVINQVKLTPMLILCPASYSDTHTVVNFGVDPDEMHRSQASDQFLSSAIVAI